MYKLCLVLHAICVNAHAPFSIDFDVHVYMISFTVCTDMTYMPPRTSVDMLHIHTFFFQLVFYMLVLLQWFTWTYMHMYMYIM